MHNFAGSRSRAQSHTMLWSFWVLYLVVCKPIQNDVRAAQSLSKTKSFIYCFFCGSSSCHISNRNVENYFKWALHTSISSIWSIEIVSLMWKCRNRINFQLNPLIFVKPNFGGSVRVFSLEKWELRQYFKILCDIRSTWIFIVLS